MIMSPSRPKWTVFVLLLLVILAVGQEMEPGTDAEPPTDVPMLTIPSTDNKGFIFDDDQWDYYYIGMPAQNASYVVQVEVTYVGGTVKAYARQGTKPSALPENPLGGSDYHASEPIAANTLRFNIYACAGAGWWYIGVWATTGLVNYTISLSELNIDPQPLPTDGTSIANTLSNQAWAYYFVDIAANNSFASVTNVPSSALSTDVMGTYLRMMSCPTLIQATTRDTGGKEQTNTLSCNTIMMGRWFVGVSALTTQSVSYSVSSQLGQMTTVPKETQVSGVLAPNAWQTYMFTLTAPQAITVNTTTTGTYSNLMVYLNKGICGSQTDYDFAAGLSGSSTANTVHSSSAVQALGAGNWYMSVTSSANVEVDFSVNTRAAGISCISPGTDLGVCAGVTNWLVANYSNVASGVASASASYHSVVDGMLTAPSATCDVVIKEFFCTQSLPPCNPSTLLNLQVCSSLCHAYASCVGDTTINCNDNLVYGSGSACAAASTLSLSLIPLTLLVLVAVATVFRRN